MAATDSRRVEHLTRLARLGSEHEHVEIAVDPDLHVDGQMAIATAVEPHVASSVLHNYGAGPEVTRALVYRSSDETLGAVWRKYVNTIE